MAGTLNVLNGLLGVLALLAMYCWSKGHLGDSALIMDIWCVKAFRGFLGFFTMIWFVVGSVYVFRCHFL